MKEVRGPGNRFARRWYLNLQALGAAATILLGCEALVVPAAGQSTVYNVMNFGAKGDGIADDAPAIQNAELAAEASGGAVYLPAGTYFMNSTVVVGSHIEIYGDGNSSVLVRSNTTSMVAMYAGDCTTNKPPRGAFRMVFINRHYNCEDDGIHLHDFEIDGSRMNEVPNSGMITFSGLANSAVDHLTLKNTPQDAIFFRNGGHNVSVHDNTILLHNLYWGNGSGIDIDGNFRPVKLLLNDWVGNHREYPGHILPSRGICVDARASVARLDEQLLRQRMTVKSCGQPRSRRGHTAR